MARPVKKKKAPAKAKSVKKAPKKAAQKIKAKPAKKPVKKILKLAKKPAKAAKPVATPKKSSASLGVGSAAPAFTMPATRIGEANSASLKGKPYILYFYPKDDTSGCTAEACEFRNTLPGFDKLGATVIGVSKDGMESHEKFSRKYNLNFPLASDENSDVCERFGTWAQKSMYGRTYMGIERSTFLVDGKGIIRAVWRKIGVPGHIEEVKKALEAL